MIWAGVYVSANESPVREVFRREAGVLREWSQRARTRAAAALPGGFGAEGAALTDDVTRVAVERARAGDADAFAELFTAHEDVVERVCRRLLGGADAAKDAQSEVFLRARRALDTFDTQRPFRPWLLAIAGNYCVDQLRHRAAEQRIFSDAEADDADLRAPGPSPLARAVAAEERDALSRAIEELPVKYRLPLALRYFGDYDYAAISEALGVTSNQVGTLLFRAKRILRDRLELAGTREKLR